MGTRSLTLLPGYDGETAVLYRQMDGYPEGHGAELAAFLAGRREVNGIGGDANIFNGAADLSASLVAHFKAQSDVGGFYLYPAGTRNVGEEYIYTVTAQGVGKPVRVKVEEGYDDNMTTVWEGTADKMVEWVKEARDV